jgi:hypothetical protein
VLVWYEGKEALQETEWVIFGIRLRGSATDKGSGFAARQEWIL